MSWISVSDTASSQRSNAHSTKVRIIMGRQAETRRNRNPHARTRAVRPAYGRRCSAAGERRKTKMASPWQQQGIGGDYGRPRNSMAFLALSTAITARN
uniref:Uncharacterized protein n=1 Tax=Oryza nivara TaxID=4536 RepID=A0A0E0H195_ORYNI